MIHIRNSVFVLFFVLCGFHGWSQTNEEIRERADKLFEKEQYVAATKDYLHLLSLEPLDHTLNFKYGACLLYNSNQKNQGLRYLNYAVQSETVDPRAYYFRGRALHLNYQFEEAKKDYRKYQSLTAGKQDKRYPVDRQIQMCDNGKRLLTTFTDIVVAEKQEIDQTKFFKIYNDRSTIGGDILVSEQFQSKFDKKMGHVPVVHFPPNAKAIYYSSYGEDGSTGLDIYERRRLPDGKWGEPQKVPGMVNTPEDEDYPYMHPSGKFLYFSSTGHNSMGGYDVFMSRFDENANTFEEPENVDFAISSPDDDLFYVVDSLFQNAYFASARQSQDGKIHVYKVKVVRVPIQEVIVMGDFISEINPDNKDMTIDVVAQSNQAEIGKVKSNAQGKYSFVFPQGGKYEYLIKVEGSQNEYRFIVDLPFQDEFRPLKQKVIQTTENGQEIVRVINLFDETAEGADALIAEVIRKKSELNVNIDQFDLEKLNAEANEKELIASLGFDDMTPREVGTQLNELVVDVVNNAENIERVQSNLEGEILAKAERIAELDKIESELLEQSEKASDPAVKYKLLNEAQKKGYEKNILIGTVKELDAMSREIGEHTGMEPDKIADLQEVVDKYNSLVDEGKKDDALDLLSANADLVRNASTGSTEDMLKTYIQRSDDIKTDLRKYKDREIEYDGTIEDLRMEITTLEGKLSNTNKKKEVDDYKQKIAAGQEELKMVEEERDKTRNKINELNKQLSIVENQIISLQNAIETEQMLAVNDKELKEAIQDVEKIDAKETVDYIAEINQLEEQYPELTGDVSTNSLAEIRKEQDSELAKINKDPNLSELEKLYRETEVNDAAISQVNDRLGEINDQLKSDPGNTDLTKEKERLETYRDNLKTENKDIKAEADRIKSETPEAALSLEDVAKEIDPAYSDRLDAISANTELSEKERLEQTLEEQQNFIGAIDQEIAQLDQQLKKDPDNSELEARKELALALKSSVSEESAQTEQQLEEIRTTEVTPVTTEVSVSEIDPQYETKVESIKNDHALSDLEREKKLKETEQALLTAVSTEKKKLEKQLKKDPENQELKDKIASLEKISEEANDRIVEHDQTIAALEPTVNVGTQVTSDDMLTEVAPKYKGQVAAVEENNALTELEKEQKLQELDQGLLAQLETEKKKLEKQLKKDPENTALKDKYVALTSLADKTKDQIAEHEQTIAALEHPSNTHVSNEELTTEVLPEYTDRKEKINQNDGLSEKEKEEQLLGLDRDLSDKLTAEKEKLSEELAADPDNNSVKERLDAVENLLADVNQNIGEREEYIASMESGPVAEEQEQRKENILKDIDPQYQEKVADLEASAGSSGEKRIELLELDQQMLDQLEQKAVELEKSLKSDPENKDKQQELQAVKELIAEVKSHSDAIKQIHVNDLGQEEMLEVIASVDKTYAKDIKALHDAGKTEEEIDRETELQEKLREKLQELYQKQKRKYSITVDLERMEVERAIAESMVRQEALESGQQVSGAQTEKETSYLETLRSENPDPELLTKEGSNKAELQDQDTQLAVYEENLLSRIDALESDPTLSEDKEKQEQLEWTKEELERVQATRRKVKISLGELETSVASSNKPDIYEDPELNKLKDENADIEAKLANESLSSSDRKNLEKALAGNKAEQTKRENELLEQIDTAQEEEIRQEVTELEALKGHGDNEQVEKAVAIINSEEQHIEELRAEADKARSEEEKNYILNEINERQENLLKTANDVKEEISIAEIEQENGIQVKSQEELQAQKRKFIVRIGDLNSEILRVEKEISQAKKKELPELEAEKASLEQEKALLEERLSLVDQQLSEYHDSAPVITNDALKEVITYKQERDLASSEEYKSYEAAASEALAIEEQIVNLEEELRVEQEAIELIVDERGADDPEIRAHIEKVTQIQAEIDRNKIELVQKKYEAENLLPDNEEEAMKLQNLALRGVKPLQKAVVATALLGLPSSGFSIDSTGSSVYSVEHPIPVNVNNPSGLFYRVQVGAFARPIPQDLFGSFTPVSGEKIEGSNITRYMAGFFNNSTDVVSARDQIRDLGYNDAFVVAYCDGKRIAFWEARKHEQDGTCLAKGANELMVEVAENTAEKMGLPLTTEVAEVSEMDYAKAPGAVESDPIENMKGLFFTVQIGVFNRPVGDEHLHGMTEILTIRLPNGQIRYASGVFNSVAEAIPRRDKALLNGVQGAFITAYYNGERIPISQAKKLLADKGPSILQNNMQKEKEEPETETHPIVEVKRTDTVTRVNITPKTPEVEELRVQVVTKSTFEEYPRDVLNRYNAEGSFYYDEKDGHVKSVIYKNEDYLPRLWNFREDIDTVFIPAGLLADEQTKIVELHFSDSIIPGDLMDWLLRFNYRREYVQAGDGVNIRIYGVQEEILNGILNVIRGFGVEPHVREETELELELNENE